MARFDVWKLNGFGVVWTFELVLPAARREKREKDSDLGVSRKNLFLHIGFAGVFFRR